MKSWMTAGVAGVAATSAVVMVTALPGSRRRDGTTSSAYGVKAVGTFPVEPSPPWSPGTGPSRPPGSAPLPRTRCSP